MKPSEYVAGAKFKTRIVYEIIDAETGEAAQRETHEDLIPVEYENAVAIKYAFMRKFYASPTKEDAETYGINGPIARAQFGIK